MPSITLSGVSFGYTDAVPVLSDVELALVPGWTGVVGANGAGKSTLLGLLCGELVPDAGSIMRSPRKLRGALCPQRVDQLDASIRDFAESDSGSAGRWRGRLGLDAEHLERWPKLSPGQRKRWQIGAALHPDPAMLALDEPTNHLDREARDLLLDALARYTGVGLIVSHDRDALEALTTNTVLIERSSARLYRGSYSVARETWERERREERERHDRLRREERRLVRRVGERKTARQGAVSQMRTGKRMKNAKDSDARLRFKQSRRRSAETGLGKEISRLQGRVDRVAEERAKIRIKRDVGRSLFVDYTPARQEILSVHEGPLDAGPKRLFESLAAELHRDSRVQLVGPNGIGKTTLLRALVRGSRVPPERVLLLPQDLLPEEEQVVLDELEQADRELRARTLDIVAALGVDPGRLLESQRPSPGELRKLALALGLAREVFLLLLDEPTNHLDLPSIERLEEALVGFPGAILVVTHDRAFARACTRTRWALGPSGLEVGLPE